MGFTSLGVKKWQSTAIWTYACMYGKAPYANKGGGGVIFTV